MWFCRHPRRHDVQHSAVFENIENLKYFFFFGTKIVTIVEARGSGGALRKELFESWSRVFVYEDVRVVNLSSST